MSNLLSILIIIAFLGFIFVILSGMKSLENYEKNADYFATKTLREARKEQEERARKWLEENKGNTQ